MREHRRNKRFIVDGMDINGKMMFATEVKILNISIGGVSLKADRRLDIGNEYTLKIDDKGRVIAVKGVVVWSSICENREGPHGDRIPIYSAGMKFTNVLSDKVLELINFIEGHTKDGEHRLSGLRFNIKAPEKAILNFPEDYRVKKISLTGMLIESAQSLETESRFPMEICLPEDEKPIRFLGRVASCLVIADAVPDQCDIGIEFMEMSETDRTRVRKFIGLLNDIDKHFPDL